LEARAVVDCGSGVARFLCPVYEWNCGRGSALNLAKSYLDRLLKNPFYTGRFYWKNKLYNGIHKARIPHKQFEQVQGVFGGRAKPRYGTYDFP
jgi:hypothetical protein